MARKQPGTPAPPSGGPLDAFTRLAAVRSIDEFWPAFDALVRPLVGHDALVTGYRSRVYMVGPAGPVEDPVQLAGLRWLQHYHLRWEGKPGIVLVEPEVVDLGRVLQPPEELQERGWTHGLFGALWQQPSLLASFVLYRRGPFARGALDAWRRLRPFCEAVLQRLVHDVTEAAYQDQMMALLDELPVGILMLDELYVPVFVNREGYRQALMWNHAPEPPPAGTDARDAFRVPEDLGEMCRDINRQWFQQLLGGSGDTPNRSYQVLRFGLKASISVTPALEALRPPSFLIRFHGMAVRAVRDFQPTPEQLALLAQLTPAERGVALLVGQGLSNQEIAHRLHREVSTVKDHLSRIFGKLGLRNRAQLARLLAQ